MSRRTKSGRRIVFWVLLPVLALAALHAGWTLLLARRFDARVDELRADGVPVGRSEDGAANAPLFREARRWYREHLAAHEPAGLYDLEADGEPDPVWSARVDGYLERVERALAGPAPRSEFLWPALSPAVKMLCYRARRAPASEAGLESLARLLDLAARVEGPRAFFLLARWDAERAAVRTLAVMARVPGFDARRARVVLAGRLARGDRRDAVRRVLRDEQAAVVAAARAWIGGESPASWWNGDGGLAGVLFGSWLGRPFAYRDALAGLDFAAASQQLADLPVREAAKRAATLRRRHDPGDAPSIGRRYWSLTLGKVAREWQLHVVQLRVARVGLALLEAKQAAGEWPQDLDAIAAEVGEETLVDPLGKGRFAYEPGEAVAAARGPDDAAGPVVWRFR